MPYRNFECRKGKTALKDKCEIFRYKFVNPLDVWFQNRRAKWKKRKKATNVFRNPGALLPSTGLNPFSSMSDAFCGFPTADARWPGMPQMAGNMNPLSLSASLGPRQTIPSSLTSSMSINSLSGHPASHMPGFGNSLGMSNGGSPPSAYTSSYSMVAQTSSCGNASAGGGGVGGGRGGSSVPGDSPSPTLPGASLQCGLSDIDEAWRGTSIAALRRKAIEHTVNIGGYR
ncbi:orthopedia homeobox protein [Plakobranchus ocellatus]|uniref:Orthopedia homeobox protein n=1 Tax=Plakobranchus ocellatus TaxID=259542 RepID=A0AAV4DQB9_9GAST|nr:orthopedia homeobox protein [Plakobranchus ocellatus]